MLTRKSVFQLDILSALQAYEFLNPETSRKRGKIRPFADPWCRQRGVKGGLSQIFFAICYFIFYKQIVPSYDFYSQFDNYFLSEVIILKFFSRIERFSIRNTLVKV